MKAGAAMAGVTPIDGKLQEQKLKSLDNVLGQIEKLSLIHI